jgi:hypothetical protein
MATSNCNQNCGCSNSYTVTAPCPPSCTEVFNAQCIVYTGTDITCGDDTVISRYDYMDTIVTKIVNYFCSRFDSLVIPTTVVQSNDPGIIVDTDVVGSVTTYTLTLDPSSFPAVGQVTAGDNVVVTGVGTIADPYVVNANESIVAVDPASALTLLVDPSTPGPYETTYTIGIDSALLPETELSSLFGFISITEIPNTPNAGDTTWQLDVDQVTVDATDVRLISTLTSPGGAGANFLRTFDITIDETEMENWIIESVIYSSLSNPKGLIAGPGIALNYNPATYQLEIENLFSDPDRWFELIDFAGFNVTPTAGNASLSIIADPATIAAGGNGIDAVLSGTGTGAIFTLTNTDPGSGQLIFGTIDCNNDGGPSVGTCAAGNNADTLTIVGGAEISVSVPSPNTIVVDCDITSIYSNVAGDTGNVAAGSVTDSLEIVGAVGSAITTAITGAPGVATLEIDWAGVTVGAGLLGTGLPADPLVNDANVYETISGDIGSTTATTLTSTLTIQGGKGITTNVGAPDAIAISASVDKYASPTTLIGAGASVPFTHNLGATAISITVAANPLPFPLTVFSQGVDYSVTLDSANEITITDLTGGGLGNVQVTVIG